MVPSMPWCSFIHSSPLSPHSHLHCPKWGLPGPSPGPFRGLWVMFLLPAFPFLPGSLPPVSIPKPGQGELSWSLEFELPPCSPHAGPAPLPWVTLVLCAYPDLNTYHEDGGLWSFPLFSPWDRGLHRGGPLSSLWVYSWYWFLQATNKYPLVEGMSDVTPHPLFLIEIWCVLWVLVRPLSLRALSFSRPQRPLPAPAPCCFH